MLTTCAYAAGVELEEDTAPRGVWAVAEVPSCRVFRSIRQYSGLSSYIPPRMPTNDMPMIPPKMRLTEVHPVELGIDREVLALMAGLAWFDRKMVLLKKDASALNLTEVGLASENKRSLEVANVHVRGIGLGADDNRIPVLAEHGSKTGGLEKMDRWSPKG